MYLKVRNYRKMTLTFDKTAYSNLLSEYIPRVLETEEEYNE